MTLVSIHAAAIRRIKKTSTKSLLSIQPNGDLSHIQERPPNILCLQETNREMILGKKKVILLAVLILIFSVVGVSYAYGWRINSTSPELPGQNYQQPAGFFG